MTGRRTLGAGKGIRRTASSIANRRVANPRGLTHETRQREVYADARWRRLRKIVLANFPLCVVGCGAKAAILDHITPIQQAHGMARAFDARNVQGMCRQCHGSKTERIDAPGNQPGRYRHDLAHEADMRPQAMKDWAEWFVSSGAQVEQVGSTSPGGSSRTAFSGDLLC